MTRDSGGGAESEENIDFWTHHTREWGRRVNTLLL